MQMNDMILVSVDDHVCEPPDMWDRHLPAKWKERAPRLVHKADGIGRLGVRGPADPQRRAQRRRGSRSRGVRHGADRALAAAPGLLRHRRAHRRHERQRRARLAVLPVGAGLRRRAVRPPGQGRPERARDHDAARLQRLAHRRLVREVPGPLHPARDPADLGSRGDGPRGAARGEEGLSRDHLRRHARRPRLPEHCTASTGIRSGRRAPTRARSSASTSARAPG